MSAALCVAVDGAGNIFSSTDPTAGQRAKWPRQNPDGTAIDSITCTSISFCLAVDGKGRVLTSTDPTAGRAAHWSSFPVGAAGWSPTPACVQELLCVFAAGQGYVLSATAPENPGPLAGWQAKDIDGNPFAGTGYQLVGVACPADTLCIAADNGGNTLTSTDPGNGSKAEWTRTNVLGRPSNGYSHAFIAIACPSTSVCVAIGDHGRTDEIAGTTEPALGAGAKWSIRTFKDPNAELTSISMRDPEALRDHRRGRQRNLSDYWIRSAGLL